MKGRLLAASLAITAVAVAAASPWQRTARGDEAQDTLARAAHGVLARHCAACHGPDLPRPKGRFGHVLDLARLATERRYVRPGDPDGSPLYLDVVGRKMPPPESGRPAVPDADRATLRAWIAAGAPPLPKGSEPATAPAADPAAPVGPQVGPERKIGQFHPLVVHFPVALLIAAVLAEILALVRRRPAWSGTSRFCLLMGSLGAVLSSITGWAWAQSEGFEATTHRWLGIGTTAFALATSLLALRARNAQTPATRWLWRIALLATTALVALTGYQGGKLTYGPEHHTWPF